MSECNSGKIKVGYYGIYTQTEVDAARLAYALGGFYHKLGANSEIHDVRPGSGYYYHFHDIGHNIHVWYGSPA